jgi:thiaminase/transcriptional activator TenA
MTFSTTFSGELWTSIATLRRDIDRLPFLTALEDGTLPQELFTYYLAQDARYLASYGRVLATAAGQADRPDELLFWAHSAATTISVERQLHAAHVPDFTAVEASPTCTAYTSYLFSLTTAGCYPAVVAGVLPCFWIYEDVGRRLKARIGDLNGHPYADWINTYGDPDFAVATEQARGIVDRVAAAASAGDRARMQQAFTTAARYERMFWDAAWRRETWPI